MGARALIGIIIVVGLAVSIGIAVKAGLDADSTRYGRVPAPGKATLDLNEGEVTAYYEERVSLGQDQSLAAPVEFAFTVRRAGGGAPLTASGPEIDEEYTSGGLTRTAVAGLDVPAAGRYVVTAGRVGAGHSQPSLVLGDSVFDAVLERASDWGAVLGGTLAFAFLMGLIGWIRRRISVEEPGPAMPPELVNQEFEIGERGEPLG